MFGATACGKCEKTYFSLKEVNVQGANYKMFAIQCTSCGTPIGITEYYDSGSLLKQQEKAIADLGNKIGHMEHTLNQIAHAMNSMQR